MQVSTSQTDGRLTFKLIGELDHHAAKNTMLKIGDAIDGALPVTVSWTWAASPLWPPPALPWC